MDWSLGRVSDKGSSRRASHVSLRELKEAQMSKNVPDASCRAEAQTNVLGVSR